MIGLAVFSDFEHFSTSIKRNVTDVSGSYLRFAGFGTQAYSVKHFG